MVPMQMDARTVRRFRRVGRWLLWTVGAVAALWVAGFLVLIVLLGASGGVTFG